MTQAAPTAAPLSTDHTPSATDLPTVVYDALRRLAAQKLAHEPPGQTLQATALVHEAWLRLGGPNQQPWENRAHFYAAAAEAMRRILIDNARRKKAARHGGHLARVDLDAADAAADSNGDLDRLLAVHEVLDRFAAHDAIKAELVKLRYFVGLTNEQAAEALGISAPTAKRYWAYARAWMFREIERDKGGRDSD